MKQLKLLITVLFFAINVSNCFTQITFQETFGGTEYDDGNFVQQTFDGGYIVSGMTHSFGTGNGDIYLLKINLLGDSLWTKTFNFSGVDDGRFVFQTSDNGFIVLRRDNTSNSDTWLLKTDENGNSLWNKYYDFDPFSLNPTNDNGYIIAGTYHQNSIKHTAILKTDQNGETLWMKTYPITDWCGADFAKQTSDNGYIISSWANDNGNLSTLIIKTDNNGNVIWSKSMSYGGKKIQQTNDDGYALIFNDFNAQYFKLAKTDENGNILWNKTYGG
nr:hypothetical protein [Bacteroidota bacterium]